MYLTLFFNESIEYTDHYHLETGECVRTLLIVRKRIFLTQRNNFFYPVGLDTRKNFINHKKEFFLLATLKSLVGIYIVFERTQCLRRHFGHPF